MKIIMFTDPIGSLQKTQKEEYEKLQKDVALILSMSINDIDFEINVPPWKLENISFDMYLFDYGGISCGAMDTMNSMLKCFHDAAENHPNALFVVWSTFTWGFYKDLMEYEIEETAKLSNVTCFNGSNWDELREWFGIPKHDEEIAGKMATKDDGGML